MFLLKSWVTLLCHARDLAKTFGSSGLPCCQTDKKPNCHMNQNQKIEAGGWQTCRRFRQASGIIWKARTSWQARNYNWTTWKYYQIRIPKHNQGPIATYCSRQSHKKSRRSRQVSDRLMLGTGDQTNRQDSENKIRPCKDHRGTCL